MREDVERVARAMAAADGFNPDEEVQAHPNSFIMQRAGFHVTRAALVDQTGPLWKTYAREANMLLAGLAARASQVQS